ncbi:MAG: vWA domain-containing protein [Anaerolineae bacterium]
MAKTDFQDAFNDCIDRLNAGESIENCVQLYPEHAELLRQLLGTAQLVYRARIVDDEVRRDQDALRDQIIARARQARSQQAARSTTSRWVFPLTAIAALLVVAIIGSSLFLATRQANPSLPEVTVALTMLHDGSDLSTEVAIALTNTNSASSLVVTLPVLLTATPPQGIVPTSVAFMSPEASSTAQPTTTTTVTTTPPGTATLLPTLGPIGTTMPTAGFAATGIAPTPAPLNGDSVVLTAAALSSLLGQGAGTLQPMLATPTPLTIIPLQAGEIDDNARWDQYLNYRSNYLQQFRSSVRDVDVTNRQIITVADEQGLPLLGARVEVYAGQAIVSDTRTYADGQTLFFPNAAPVARGQQSYRVVVTAQNNTVEFTLDPQRGPLWTVQLSEQRTASAPKLDVLFLLDSTSSMADEITQLQNNILAISSHIAALPGNVDTRYSLVTYRDRGDAYVTQQYDFVPNVADFQARLNAVQADGGGDGPESLNEALHVAVQNVSWRGADTVKLVFLVADAAPHLDYANDYDYSLEMAEAAGKGIKIHPIASSGLTPDGEFIFRQLAQYTFGHFLFLTYEQGRSGAPGESRPDLSVGTPASPETGGQGDYSVEQLDELVLRLITEELAALNQPIQQRGGVVPALTSVPPQTGAVVPPAPRLSLILPVAFGTLVASIVVGYTFRFRSPIERRKRKNDEFEIVEAE